MKTIWEDISDEVNNLCAESTYKIMSKEEIEHSRINLINSIENKQEIIENNLNYYLDELENTGVKGLNYRDETNLRNEIHDKIDEHRNMIKTADKLIVELNHDGLKETLKYYKEELEELGRFDV